MMVMKNMQELIMTNLRFLVWLLLASSVVYAQQFADPQAQTISEIESLLFDGNPIGIFSGVTPCTIEFDSSTGGKVNNSLGRQTSAQWIRTAFRKNEPFSNERFNL